MTDKKKAAGAGVARAAANNSTQRGKPTTVADPPQLSALDWALAFARRGWPVFPLRGKLPAIAKRDGGRGFHDATCDEKKIRAWAKRYPRCNWGIRCGAESGIAVIDVDAPGDEHADGFKVLADLEREHGAMPKTLTVETGRGGRHFIFKHPGGKIVSRDEAFFGRAGVDSKADGGYIVAPGSIHPKTRKAYRVLVDAPLAPMRAWMVERLRPATAAARAKGNGKQKPRGGATSTVSPGDISAYAAKALGEELARVASANVGARNATLNRATFALAQLVGGGALDEARTRGALTAAALGTGLDAEEIAKTIASAFDAGKREARRVPEPAPRAAASVHVEPEMHDASLMSDAEVELRLALFQVGPCDVIRRTDGATSTWILRPRDNRRDDIELGASKVVLSPTRLTERMADEHILLDPLSRLDCRRLLLALMRRATVERVPSAADCCEDYILRILAEYPPIPVAADASPDWILTRTAVLPPEGARARFNPSAWAFSARGPLPGEPSPWPRLIVRIAEVELYLRERGIQVTAKSLGRDLASARWLYRRLQPRGATRRVYISPRGFAWGADAGGDDE